MRHLHSMLEEIPLLIKVGFVVMILLGGYYLFGLRTPVRSPDNGATTALPQSTVHTGSLAILATSIPANNLELDSATTLPATDRSVRPTETRIRPTQQVVTQDLARSRHYLDVARQSVQTAMNEQTATSDETNWHIWVTDDRTSKFPVIMVTLPLERSNAQSDEEFVLAAKETLLQVINTLVLDDPNITRIGAVGTFPNADGKVLPAVSLIIHKTKGQEWTPMAIDDLHQMVHTLYVRLEFMQSQNDS